MPKAGWCDVENAWVWVNDDGSCVNGHGPEHVSRVYDTDTQTAPPPVVETPPPAYVPAPPAQPQQPTYPAAPPVAPGQYPYQTYQQVPVKRDNKPVIALVLGIGSILCCFPIITIPMGIAGLVMGIQSLNSDRRGLAIAAIVVSSIGIVGSIINAALGVFFNVSNPDFLNNLQDLK